MKTVRFTFADRDIMTYIIGFILIQRTVTSKELSNDIVLRMAVKQVFAHLTVQFIFQGFRIIYLTRQFFYCLAHSHNRLIFRIRCVSGKFCPLLKLLLIHTGDQPTQPDIPPIFRDRYSTVFERQHYRPLVLCVNTMVGSSGAESVWEIGLPGFDLNIVADEIHLVGASPALIS